MNPNMTTICPRCHGAVPTESEPGAYAGAMSRATPYREIEICSTCGTDEIYNLVKVANWPVASWSDETIKMIEFVETARRNGGL